MLNNIFSEQEVAQMLGVPVRLLERYREQGVITYMQVGSVIFYEEHDILNFLKKFKVDGNGQKI
jgi:hypothetical protein